jgi:hypothetical protein
MDVPYGDGIGDPSTPGVTMEDVPFKVTPIIACRIYKVYTWMDTP